MHHCRSPVCAFAIPLLSPFGREINESVSTKTDVSRLRPRICFNFSIWDSETIFNPETSNFWIFGGDVLYLSPWRQLQRYPATYPCFQPPLLLPPCSYTTSHVAMSLKRPQASLSDFPFGRSKAVISSRYINPLMVLEAVEKLNFSDAEALLWVKTMMQRASEIPEAPEAKKKTSHKRFPLTETREPRSWRTWIGSVEFNARYDGYLQPVECRLQRRVTRKYLENHAS